MTQWFRYLWVAFLSVLSVEGGATCVFDPSGALADSAAVLERQLERYHAATGHRIAVAILDDDVSNAGFEAWAVSAAQRLGLHGAEGSREVWVVMRKTDDLGRIKAWIVPGRACAADFPRMFCKHVGSDQIAGPVKDGFSYMHGIGNGLPYIKAVLEGRATASDYEDERRGSGWKWLIAAGALLIVIAVGARKWR